MLKHASVTAFFLPGSNSKQDRHDGDGDDDDDDGDGDVSDLFHLVHSGIQSEGAA